MADEQCLVKWHMARKETEYSISLLNSVENSPEVLALEKV